MNKPEPSRALRMSARLYRLLLLAYPASFRREYGEPMVQLFRDCSARAFSEAGYWRLVRLWWGTLGDLICTSLREHFARLECHRPVPIGESPPMTPRARRSLEIALREAATAGRGSVGLEHVLLGLIEEGTGDRIGKKTGVAGFVLRSLAVNARQAREKMAIHQHSAAGPATDSADFVPTLIRSAETEARRLGHPFVGAEHLLLGLIGEQKSTLEAFLQPLGVSVEQVQRTTLGVIVGSVGLGLS